MSLLDNIKFKFVQGENIAQTSQFFCTGIAELSFVALSQIIEARKGEAANSS